MWMILHISLPHILDIKFYVYTSFHDPKITSLQEHLGSISITFAYKAIWTWLEALASSDREEGISNGAGQDTLPASSLASWVLSFWCSSSDVGTGWAAPSPLMLCKKTLTLHLESFVKSNYLTFINLASFFTISWTLMKINLWDPFSKFVRSVQTNWNQCD